MNLEEAQTRILQRDIDSIAENYPLINYGSDVEPLWVASIVAVYLGYTSVRHAVARLRVDGHIVDKRILTRTRGYQTYACVTCRGIEIMLRNKKITGVALRVYSRLFKLIV